MSNFNFVLSWNHFKTLHPPRTMDATLNFSLILFFHSASTSQKCVDRDFWKYLRTRDNWAIASNPSMTSRLQDFKTTSVFSFLSSFQSSLLFTYNPVLLSLTPQPSSLLLSLSLFSLWLPRLFIVPIADDCDAIPDSMTREDNPLTVTSAPWVSPWFPRVLSIRLNQAPQKLHSLS